MSVNTMYSDVNNENEFKYDFRTSFIYKYMKWTFQYTCETDWFQQTRTRKGFYTIGQIGVLLIGWSYYGFNCYDLMLHLNNYIKKDVFNATVDLIYALLSTFELIGLLTIGHYLMKRHPFLIQDQFKGIKNLVASSSKDANEVDRMIKKSERQVYDFMAVAAVIDLLMPIITNMLFLVNKHWSKNLNSEYGIFIILSPFVIHLLSMPFLFLTLFIVRLQTIQLKLLFEKITLCQNDENVIHIFNCYVDIHDSIKKVNKACTPYVIFLIISFGLEGSVGIYTEVVANVAFFKLPGLTYMDIIYAIFTLACYIADVSLQYLLPILTLASVSRDQMKVAPLLLKSAAGRADLHNVHRLAHSIDLLQRTEGVGYNVFNSPITRWKAVSWVLIGPIVKVLFSRLI